MTDFFIASPPRSGGTLVYSVLCADPGMPPVLMENHFLSMAAAAYRSSRDRLDFEQGHFFSDMEDVQTFYRSWINAFLDKQRKRHAPARHLAIKSILLGPQCPMLYELLPNAIQVMVVRDPRDIIASMIEVGKKQEGMGKPNQYPRDIKQLAGRLINHYQPAMTCNTPGFKDSMLYIRYEDVVSNIQSVIDRIQKRTGLDLSGFDPENAWQRSHRSFDASAAEKDAFMTESYGKSITTSSLGRFSDTLAHGEVEQIEYMCAPLMKLFHYA